MSSQIGLIKKLKEKSQSSPPESAQKIYSDRDKKRNDKSWSKVTPRGIPEAITYVLMKEKMSKIYMQGEKYTLDDQHILIKIDSKETQTVQSRLANLPTEIIDQQSQSCYLESPFQHEKWSHPFSSESSLQVNTVSQREVRSRGKGVLQQAQLIRKSRYRKRVLDPLNNEAKPKMSNNIKDYLSVEKISIKEMEESLLGHKIKLLKQYNHSNLLAFGSNPEIESKETVVNRPLKAMMGELPIKKRPDNLPRIFKPPFGLYYYRDFMWKVAFSNDFLVQPFSEYQAKIKWFVGKGNNSNLIKGIIKRRTWFQLTDKVQDAQFVWTQIKVPSIFQTQLKGNCSIKAIEGNQAKIQKGRQSFSLFNFSENQKWNQYWQKNLDKQRSIKQNLRTRTKIFGLAQKSAADIKDIKIHNHFCNNFLIGNKKALFQTMSEYYSNAGQEVFKYLPLTFHIKNGLEDDQYLIFLKHFYAISKTNKTNQESINKFNAWIVKPGENTNRGTGIIVCLDLNEIKTILKRKQKHDDGTYKTYILQKYIQRPLLYKRRKFDLRHYMMLNCSNGCMKGYWYRQGYVRTTSSEYTLQISSGSVHLTNDAVQKCLPDYGKYEKGNKITYEQLDSYISKSDPQFNFFRDIYPKMKKIATDTIRASALSIDPQKRMNNFQIFGLDFMIDANYDVWLIEVNTNPCLETTCPVLNKIIPRFVENTFQICIDPLFPAPLNFQSKFGDYYKNLGEENNYEIVFDERVDKVNAVGSETLANQPDEQEDVFDDDGQNFQD